MYLSPIKIVNCSALAFFIALNVGCSSSVKTSTEKTLPPSEKATVKKSAHTKKESKKDYGRKIASIETVQELFIRPGEVKRIEFLVESPEKGAQLLCKKHKVPSFWENGVVVGYLPLSYFSKDKKIKCVYKSNQSRQVASVEVKKKDYPSERLRVNKRRVTLNKKDLTRVRREQKFLNKVYASSRPIPWFNAPFMFPLDSYITSIYGTRRVFNNKKHTQHLGTDYRAPVGEPIFSTNAGQIVVSRNLFYTGNTVVIDHGMGIFTVYGHLSKLDVKESDYVPKNYLIGSAGKTGRVTGPHLHWGVKIQGHYVDGSSLVRETSYLGK